MSSNEWEEHKLEDVLECLIDYRGKTPTKTATGIPLVTAKIVKNGFVQKPDEYIAESDYESWMTRGFPEIGDVLLTTEAPLGEVAQLNIKRVALAQRLVTLRGKKKILDNGFLKYFLRSDVGQARLKARETGTTVTGIKQSELRQIMIPLPRIETQRAIAATLSALDDKIELNNRINKTLEEMAQALFKRWFVDFEFPDENDQPYKSSGGELVESELGLIPKGWKLASLDSIADYLNGLAMQKYRPEGDEFIPVIKIRELNQGKSDAQSDKASPKIDSKYIVNDGDVLFSWSGSLDVKIWCGGKGGLNQHLFKVTSGRYEKWFYYLWTKHHLEKFRGIAQDKATTMGHIQRKHLQESFAATPDHNCLERMNSVMRPIFDAYITGAIEAATLVAIRDTILPKLISGEIRVNGSLAEDIGNGEG